MFIKIYCSSYHTLFAFTVAYGFKLYDTNVTLETTNVRYMDLINQRKFSGKQPALVL